MPSVLLITRGTVQTTQLRPCGGELVVTAREHGSVHEVGRVALSACEVTALGRLVAARGEGPRGLAEGARGPTVE